MSKSKRDKLIENFVVETTTRCAASLTALIFKQQPIIFLSFERRSFTMQSRQRRNPFGVKLKEMKIILVVCGRENVDEELQEKSQCLVW